MIGIVPTTLSYLILAYAGAGILTAVAFLWRGLESVHPAAHGGYKFRPLLIPGLALLWPYVLLRWRRGPTAPPIVSGQRRQRDAHARIWLVLAVAPPLILLGGLILRQGAAVEAPPVRLAPPP